MYNMSSFELVTIKNIRKKMREEPLSYRALSEKTGISMSRLRRCLELWSTQSMTLSDLERIYQALNMSIDLTHWQELHELPDPLKLHLCQFLKEYKLMNTRNTEEKEGPH